MKCFTIYAALFCFTPQPVWDTLENAFPEEHRLTAPQRDEEGTPASLPNATPRAPT